MASTQVVADSHAPDEDQGSEFRQYMPYWMAVHIRELFSSAAWHECNQLVFGKKNKDAKADLERFEEHKLALSKDLGKLATELLCLMSQSAAKRAASERFLNRQGTNTHDQAFASSKASFIEVLLSEESTPLYLIHGPVREWVDILEELAFSCAWYVANERKGYSSDATRDLVRLVRAFDRLYTCIGREKWKGVNLGGWLLLEKGPSYPLYENQNVLEDEEWAFCRAMHAEGRADAVFHDHRESFVTEDTFINIKNCGLNAVRLPFGYWVVLGPTGNDIFVGPALEYIDRALDWAEKHQMQVLLDLHGNPGGESREKPCGKSDPTWTFEKWRTQESLEALRILATRYRGRSCVTGLQVCNEPDRNIPPKQLVEHYVKAVHVIRECGMSADKVTVVCPFFFLLPWQKSVFRKEWNRHWLMGSLDNCAVDLHYYHFGMPAAINPVYPLRALIKMHGQELDSLPSAVVGEWSMGRPINSNFSLKEFFNIQFETYSKKASHGLFFWSWTDGAGAEWTYPKDRELLPASEYLI